MNIIFFGTPSFVVPVLEALTKKYDVVAVVTAPDKKVGRKQLLTPSPVKQFALAQKIPVLHPQMENETWKMENITADLFVVAAYGKIIPQSILELPTFGAVNIHPSPLPKYRGPSPITQTILNGDTTSAISFMKMDEQMDHGPILKSVPYDIPEETTTESLTPQIFAKAAELLPQVVDDYVDGKLEPVEQNHDEATYTHIIKKEDGFIDLDTPPSPEQLNRMIRAYYLWPSVWTKWQMDNGQWKILKLLPNNMLQMEGGKPMSIKDFLNGYPELEEKIQKILH